ncbi:hypothetical protein ACFFTN_26680 [Aminobacter aganoensis]|uniref:Uncharacterized protein n=1 Tax=Aminobacter aganoensis TaxID=83264 RepID=A0A7X0FDQ0_9HYPH|nr:hypothetical protein [Aminobacter aganoensis]MBB6357872.1 hypothetical protein [Aminobacter aganoensis]
MKPLERIIKTAKQAPRRIVLAEGIAIDQESVRRCMRQVSSSR